MLLSDQQTGIGASVGIFGNGNSNDAKIRLLERRLRGDTPSPGKFDRVLSIGEVRMKPAQMSIILRSAAPFPMLLHYSTPDVGTLKPLPRCFCHVGRIW